MMANVQIPAENANDLEKHIKTLKELRKELAKDCDPEPDENSIERFKEVSLKLNSILPDISDRKPFEFDDVLYPEDDKTAANASKTTLYSEETITQVSLECFNSYQYYYRRMINARNQRPKTSLYDTTYLQLLENVSRDQSWRGSIVCSRMIELITNLVFSMNEFKLCLSIKILIYVVNNLKDVLEFQEYKNYFLWLRNLSKIPQAKDPNKKIVTSWLAEQSKFICDKIVFLSLQDKNALLEQFLDKYGDEVETSIEYLLISAFYGYGRVIVFNKLYTYFMSAQNGDEKLERLRAYLQIACIDNTAQFVMSFREVESDFQSQLRTLKMDILYTDEQLRDMEKHYNYVMEPYLSDDAFNSIVWRPNVRQLINDKLSDGKPSDNEKETSEEHDYTIEHFILFDHLMKTMHVLNILYAAAYKCQDLLEVTGFTEVSVVFRCKYSLVIEYLNEVITNKTKRGYIPWWIETVLRKCPFMFLSNYHDYLMEDLIKLMKGEHIDESTEEKLFLAVNTAFYKPTYNI